MIETGSALLVVLASISLLRFLLSRSGLAQGRGRSGSLELLEVRALSARQRICLVRVDGERLLVGSSEAGLTLLTRLPAAAQQPASAIGTNAGAGADATAGRDAAVAEVGAGASHDATPAGWSGRLHRALRTALFLAIVLAPGLGLAQEADPARTVSIALPGLTGPGEISTTLEILAVMTLVSIAPSLLLMATCFTRIVIVLALLRQAIGLQSLPPNQVLVGLALFTTFFVMAPVADQIHTDAYTPYVESRIDVETAAVRAAAPVRRFLFAHTREKDLDLFVSMRAQGEPVSIEDVPITTVLPAFMLSELRTAFEIGFLVYLPFLVIDLVIASMLISMGMIVLPPIVISLPFKLMLFVLMDGWNRVLGSLVSGLS